MGLHERYREVVGDELTLAKGTDNLSEKQRRELRKKFDKMMGAVYEEKGAHLGIKLLENPEVMAFIDTHTAVLDDAMKPIGISDRMRSRLEDSNFIFSGMKTFHELNEAFPSLLDEKGNKKPFEQFLNDVRKVHDTYNERYLRTEYDMVHSAAQMAARWEDFEADGDNYYLQYRTAGDDHVRAEHATLDGITLPMSSPFWNTHTPPNGWACRCYLIQVRKSDYKQTPHEEAMARGKKVMEDKKSRMFRYNPGKEGKTMPDYNPYTLSKCNSCPVPKESGKLTLAFEPKNEVCAACQFFRRCQGKTKTAKLRVHYKKEMQPLIGKTVKVKVGKDEIEVEFKEKFNKHLINDVLTKDLHGIDPDVLPVLDKMLEQSAFLKEKKYHKDKIKGAEEMLYFRSKYGNMILNVVKISFKCRKKNKEYPRYFLYSISREK